MRFRWTLAAVLLAAPALYAATQVQEVWGTYGGNGFFSWDGQDSTAYGEARRRTDSERSRFLSHTPDHFITIERMDLDKLWRIDARKKRYTEESISAAREKARQDAEKARQNWEKKEAKEKPAKEEEPKMQIRSVHTRVTGPGASETINGFSCRPYQITTVIEYESLPDHKPAGRQSIYEKTWTSEAPLLAQYRKDEMAFWKSSAENQLTKQEMRQLMESVQKQLQAAQKDSAQNPWTSYASATAKVKGYPVRTIFGFTLRPEQAPAKPVAAEAKDEGLVQSGDLSGGVGGLLGNVAGRWASKTVEKKVEKKMAEQPAWVEEASKDLKGEVIGWGWMNEIKSVSTVDQPDLFEVPAGYKKVSSL